MSSQRPSTVPAEGENSYRSIFKGVTVFGGVQVFLILINLVRGKFVAMILGPAGLGVSSLFSSASNTIVRASSLGLNLAVVREVAQQSDNPPALGRVFAAVKALVRFTALAGCLFCVLCAPWLSRVTFKSPDYAWQFMLLGVAVYFTVSGAAHMSLLQGMHRVRQLSRASLVGALTGLFAGVPLYWLLGTRGIVPAMCVLAITTWAFYWWHTRRLTAGAPRFSRREHRTLVRALVATGLLLMAGELLGNLCTYVLNVYLRNAAGNITVGYFQAAFSITNQYSGAIFTALLLDYFPRLSRVVTDNVKTRNAVNHQTEIVVLVMLPIACVIIFAAPLLIRLLLTESFLPVANLVRLLALAFLLRAMQFPLGYVAYAKDNKRVFFLLEGIYANTVTLLCYIGGFGLWGLDGLGYGLIAEGVVSFAVYIGVNRRLYDYRVSGRVARVCAVSLGLCAATLGAAYIPDGAVSAGLMGASSVVATAYALMSLRRRLRRT